VKNRKKVEKVIELIKRINKVPKEAEAVLKKLRKK